MKTTALATTEPQPLAAPSPTIAHILSAAVQGGVTAENVAVVKELLTMQRDLQAQEAKRDFARDFNALQSACQPVTASKIVPGNGAGEVRYRYAPFEAIMREVSPLLKEHGFAVTFDTDIQEGRVVVTCTLIHVSGHERSNKFAARIGKGPPASSEAQGDGAATTYAKRFALCAALNIVVEQDTDGAMDARNMGSDITESQAAELQLLVEETGSDVAKFLAHAGAPSFAKISTSRYDDLVEMLQRKQRTAR